MKRISVKRLALLCLMLIAIFAVPYQASATGAGGNQECKTGSDWTAPWPFGGYASLSTATSNAKRNLQDYCEANGGTYNESAVTCSTSYSGSKFALVLCCVDCLPDDLSSITQPTIEEFN